MIMLLIQLCILYFTLITNARASRVLFEVHKSEDFANLTDVTVGILTSCYENEHGAVGLGGKLSESLVLSLTSQSTRPVVLLDNTSRKVSAVSVSPQFRQKLQLFVVSASSTKVLMQVFSQIKESKWWNHMASFLIIDGSSPGLTNGCTDALEKLHAAWKMNLLNAKYICSDPILGPVVYDFNPFTKKAPKSWQLVTTLQSDRPWTLFKQEYRNDDGSCDRLNFDKTADLDGYKIRATVKILDEFALNENKSGVDSFDGTAGMTAQLLFRAMRANATLLVYQATDGAGWWDRNGRPIAMDTVDGNSDIALNPMYEKLSTFAMSSTVSQSEVGILTQRSGEMSQLRKIFTVVDVSTRYGVLIVLIMTWIFFKVFRALDSMAAILNVVRLLCNSCLTRAPKNVPARIYLSGFFLLMLNIQSLFQGELASRLTKPMFYPNVESLEDLVDQGHNIYGGDYYAWLFPDPPYKAGYVTANGSECIRRVLEDSSAACIKSRLYLVREAKRSNLQLSRDSINIMNNAYVIREDWPLEQRFNRVMVALIEAGVLARAREEVVREDRALKVFFKIENEKDKYEVIYLGDLTFIFVVLGIGLSFATVCFVCEVAFEKIF